jgi:hypothetical protein
VDNDSVENTGVDDDSIENTGVGEMNAPDNTGVEHGGIAGVPAQADSEPETEETTLETKMDRKYVPWDKQARLRPQKPRNYSHLYVDLEHTALLHAI